jgi:hypothetical protein
MNIDKIILEAKKKGKKVNPWAVCTSSMGEKIGTTERSEWSKSDKEKYERCVLDVKKKQNIKEDKINEIGGYDDSEIYARHAGSYMGLLKSNYNNIAESLSNLDTISKEVLDDRLRESIMVFLNSMEIPLKKLMYDIKKADQRNLRNLGGDTF